MTKGKLLGSREGVSKYFLAASAMPWVGSAGGGCMTRSFGEVGMHRSEAEGRFGVAEPEGRASVCAEPL